MKLHLLSSLAMFLFLTVSSMATDHVISTSGLTYAPAELTVNVGDNITINASSVHPTTEVSQATWEANGTAALVGGFGTNTASFTFTVEEVGIIYYVCDDHIASGMKGLINVLDPVGIPELVNSDGFTLNSNPLVAGLLSYTLVDKELIGSQVEIIDLSGKLVFQERLISSSAAFQTNLKVGVYLLVIRRNDEAILFTQRVFIEN